MKRQKQFIFVGAKKPISQPKNPGGQLTASLGLLSYAEKHDYKVYVLDTTQASFPMPNFIQRLSKGIVRIINSFLILIFRKIDGVIIFSSAGFSFYERSAIAWVSRVFGIESILFMRSGIFKNEILENEHKARIAKILLRAPSYVGIQGDSWRPFFLDLGVEDNRLLTIRNWLPSSVNVVNKPVVISGSAKVRFCFVGWLIKEKGVLELLSACKMMADNGLPFHMTLVGGGTLEGFSQEYVRTNELQDVVSILGWQDSVSVANILRQSHVFVLPSYAEGFPNSLLEAMAAGLPAICTDVGAISDSLKNDINGFLISPMDIGALYDAMKRYTENRDLVRVHSVNAIKNLCSQHDMDANCSTIFAQFN